MIKDLPTSAQIKDILWFLRDMQGNTNLALRSTHGMATMGYMRWHGQDTDTLNFKQRHRQGFFDVYHFISPEVEQVAPRARAPEARHKVENPPEGK